LFVTAHCWNMEILVIFFLAGFREVTYTIHYRVPTHRLKSLKFLDFFSKFEALTVLENSVAPCKPGISLARNTVICGYSYCQYSFNVTNGHLLLPMCCVLNLTNGVRYVVCELTCWQSILLPYGFELIACTFALSNMSHTLCLKKTCQLKIITIDFDDIWQKYSKCNDTRMS